MQPIFGENHILSCQCSLQDGWLETPEGRFPTINKIINATGSHSCLGIFITDQYAMAAADCIDKIGIHPIVILNPGGQVQDWLPESRQVRALVWGLCSQFTHDSRFSSDTRRDIKLCVLELASLHCLCGEVT